MQKHFMYILLAAALLALGACQSHGRLDELKDFVEKVGEEGPGYTEERWTEINEEFTRLLDKVQEIQDLTPEEAEEIGKLQGQYAVSVFKYHGQKLMQEWEKAGKSLEGFIDGVSESLEETDGKAEKK